MVFAPANRTICVHNILNTNLSNFNVCQGGSLNIDLDILIEEIYISPNSSDDFMEKIKQLLPDNLKNKVIKKSEISYR
jgi:DNA-directed RNA polymerase alpha subunit